MLRLGIAVAGLACAACPADAARVAPALYGNVHYIEEADDTVGMELRVHSGPKPWIDFVLCEGECAPQVRLGVTRTAGGFRFDYHETGSDPDGRPTQTILHFTATYRGRSLIVAAKDAPSEKLRPLRKPIALQ